jgi:lipid-binding SYLF domain-containing protein
MQRFFQLVSGLVVGIATVTSFAQFAPQPVTQPMAQPVAQPIPQAMTYGTPEIQTVVMARQALDEFFGLSIESIPPNMLNDASGVAIFPNMIKGGFILGVNYGKGVLHVRNQDGSWSPPVMVTMGGGSLGFQAGVQAADIILVFKTPRSLNGILNGQKVTLGADASIAAGPVGRQANASTDARLGAEIYSYARSRGLFLGVSLGGSDVSIDNNANAMLYGRFGVTPADVFQNRGLAMRPEVAQLIQDLDMRTRRPVAPPAAQPVAVPPGQPVPFGQPAAVSQPAPPVAVPSASAVPAATAPAARLSAVPQSQVAPPLAPVQQGAPPANVANPPLVPIVPR